MTKTKAINTKMQMEFLFKGQTKNFAVTVDTEGTGDCFEDIWRDICSYLYNVQAADDTFEDGLATIFEEYPDYSYEIKEEN